MSFILQIFDTPILNKKLIKKTMSDELIIFQAMCTIATKFNKIDFYEWQQRKSYDQMATDIANELKKMGYALNKVETSDASPTEEISTHK